MIPDPLDMPVTKRDLLNYPTKEDLKKELSNFATKDDLKNFATKDELKNFATKDDLKNFATKDDLKNFATKDELSERLTKSSNALRREIEYMFQMQDEKWERRFIAFESRIITLIDPLLRELETRQQDREILTAWYADHEKRISTLEKQSKLTHRS